MNFNSLKYLISGIYPPHIWFPLLLFLHCKNKQKIKEDVKQWSIHCHMKDMNFMHTLSHLLIFENPFGIYSIGELDQLVKFLQY